MSGFKFPDELGLEGEEQKNEVEIEIEDDTPVEDRNKEPMPKEIVEKLDKDELDQYGDEVKEKLKQMKKVYHDERREKERALRDQQDAIAFAKRVAEENKRIKQMLSRRERVRRDTEDVCRNVT